MKRLRLVLLGFSVIAILAMALFLGKDYLPGNSKNLGIEPVIEMSSVVRIITDLKRGDLIDSSKFSISQVKTEELPKGVLQDASKINNYYAKVDLYAGEYVYENRITNTEPNENMQRVTISLTPLGAAAGRLERGQIVTIRVKNNISAPTTVTDPITGESKVIPSTQDMYTITKTAEISAVVDANLQDKERFMASAQGVESSSEYFVPKYALILVTPQEADIITKYDDDDRLRLAINE